MLADLIIRSDGIIDCRDNSPLMVTDGYIAIAGDRIIELGKGDVSSQICGSRTEIIDARGKVVIPGLIDAHTTWFTGDRGKKSWP